MLWREIQGEHGLWVLLPRPGKTHLYLLGNKQGQERGSNPVNHLHSAVYNGASALLILISAGGTNIESDLFTHMAEIIDAS